ncbi:MAG: hypothetical protein U0531_18625 [Dehalococcoidia bacterium]
MAPALAAIILLRSAGPAWRAARWPAGAALVAGHLPFVLAGHGDDLLRLYRDAALTTQRLSYSAYNLWWPVTRMLGPRSTDPAISLGGLQVTWGLLAAALVAGAYTVTAIALLRRRGDAGALLACAYLIYGFAVVGAGIHERYSLPAVAFLAPALPLARVWAPVALGVSATLTVNVVMTLPFDKLYRQGEPVWLALGVAAANVATLALATRLMLACPRSYRVGPHEQAPRKHD